MTDPPVSVLLPFHNAAATLDAALESISGQTHSEFQVLAIDDRSSDGSREIAARWSSRDARFRTLVNRGSGLVSALNQGLKEASAPLIARMDADDLMRPERLARQLAYLRDNREIALLGSATHPFPEAVVSDGFRHYVDWQNGCNTPEQIAEEIYVESPFAHPTVMFRKEAVTAAGGYREGAFPEDYELWLRLHRSGHRMAKLPEVLLDWRDHPDRLSRSDQRCSREAFDRLRARYLATDPRLRSRAGNFVIWGAGRITRKRCRHLLDKGLVPRAWVDIDPRKIGNRLKGIPVVAPDWLDRLGRPFVLVYVASHGAREVIGAALEEKGYTRGRDYLAVG